MPQQAVVVELTNDLDVGRGDLVCRPGNQPHIAQSVEATVCWLTEHSELQPGATYTLANTTQTTPASVHELAYRLDIDTQRRDRVATSLWLNEIGKITLTTQRPLHFDPYQRNRTTGSFILIDDATHDTVAAGMIIRPSAATPAAMPNVVWNSTKVRADQRSHRGMTVWLTGLSGAGKTVVGRELERRLVVAGRPAYLLDGDNLGHSLNADLGFSASDRVANIRRVATIAQLFADAGVVAIVSLISPSRRERNRVRKLHANAGHRFVEVYVDTPLKVCEHRDPKRLYARARAGEIIHFTGINDAYEPPESPDLVVRPADGSPATMAQLILDVIADDPG